MANVTGKNPQGKRYCTLCRTNFIKTEAHGHMQSMLHHRELESFMGSAYTHECQACGTTFLGLKLYASHISSPKHKANMKKLIHKNVKAIPIEKSLDEKALLRIWIRNKELKHLEKKEKNKNRKHDLQQHKTTKPAKGGKKSQKRQNKKLQMTLLSQKAAATQPEPKVRNKENRSAGRPGWLLPGPAGTSQHHGEGLPSQSERLRHDKQTQLHGWVTREEEKLSLAGEVSRPVGVSYYLNYARSETDMDYTSDDLPQTGSILFDTVPMDVTEEAQDTGRGRLGTPVSASRFNPNPGPPQGEDEDAGPVRRVDVDKMLSLIRSSVRMKKVASSAAQIQPPSGGVEAHRGRDQQEVLVYKRAKKVPPPTGSAAPISRSTGLTASSTSSVQSRQVSTSNPAPARAPPRPQETEDGVQRRTKPKVRMEERAASSSPGGDGARQGASPGARPGALALPASLSRHMSKAGPQPEPNLNAARRVRNASESRRSEGEKEAGLKPTLQKLLTSAGSQRKVNWREVYQEAHRKKQEKVKGMPRFGIELVNPFSDNEGFPLEEGDLPPLTEGFQWEGTHADPRPPLPDPPAPQPQEALDRGGPSGARSQTAAGASGSSTPAFVKEEPGKNLQDAGLVHRAERTKKKKKRAADGESPGVSVSKSSGKKQKSEPTQVDQLLAVSLKEEELSRSMLAVDGSLIQARSVLQAAYTEVQRLLLVKQQVSAEISGLRARRIEILQGMQEGFSLGAGNGNADTVQPPEGAACFPQSTPPPPLVVLNPYMASSILSPSPPSPSLAAPLQTLAPIHTPSPPLAAPLQTLAPFHTPFPSPAAPLQTLAPFHTASPPLAAPLQTLAPFHTPSPSTANPNPYLPAPCVLPQPTVKTESVLSHSQGTGHLSQNPLRTSHSPLAATAMPGPPSTSTPAPSTPTPSTPGPSTPGPSTPAPSTPTPSTPSPSTPGPSNPATTPVSLPAVPSPSQQRAVSSSAALTPSTSGDTQLARQPRLAVEEGGNVSDSSSSASDSEENSQGPIGRGVGSTSAAPIALDDSDCSVEMVEPAAGGGAEVFAVEDSDSEDDPGAPGGPVGPASSLGSASSLHPGPPAFPEPLASTPVESSSTATQTHAPPLLIKGIKPDPSGGAAPVHAPQDEEPSLGRFLGHAGPVHGLQIHEGLLYTCSGDNTARAFNLMSRECQAVFEGHTSKINCLLVSSLPGLPARLYTGSSDQTIRCYSIKSKKCLEQIRLPDRVLCLHIAWKILYVGLANGSVVSFELKTQRQLDVFECHGPRGISCLGSGQEGARRVLLVGSYDSSISVRDARSGLLLRSLQGHTKTVLCIRVVNDLVFSGSSDTSVHAHNIHTGELIRIYKGHGHAVTALAILGKVMVTASLDRLVRVYELQSHDRLQVYGGHSDMVMCMAIHKSVIYTGCYDGTVQAVKLNLMKNYRCWWYGCSLIFGVTEHLLQHLLCDHSNAQLQTVKCRWRNCEAFFSTRDATQKELPGHMQGHVEMDSQQD